MPIQIIEENRRPSSSERFGETIGQLGRTAGDFMQQMNAQKQERAGIEAENAYAKKLGYDLSGIKNQDIRKEIFKEIAKEGSEVHKAKREEESLNRWEEKEFGPGNERSMQPQGEGSGMESEEPSEDKWAKWTPEKIAKLKLHDPKKGKIVEEMVKANQDKTPISFQKTPKKIVDKMEQIIEDNPNASAEELELKLQKGGVPRAYISGGIESRRRTEEKRAAETLPMKQDIAQKADIAAQSLQNKEKQLEIIDRGNLNDPTVAAILSAMPFRLGERFLSKDTAEYKAALVDDYRDLKTLFSGTTRIKEIEILESKIADTYFTDDQKKRIIKARMNSLGADVIKAEVASEVEDEMPGLGVLKFTAELNKRMKSKMNPVSDQLIDELTNIQNEADTQKSRPLDVSNPKDEEIMDQILQEAGGNVEKAYKLAEKRGYKVLK